MKVKDWERICGGVRVIWVPIHCGSWATRAIINMIGLITYLSTFPVLMGVLLETGLPKVAGFRQTPHKSRYFGGVPWWFLGRVKISQITVLKSWQVMLKTALITFLFACPTLKYYNCHTRLGYSLATALMPNGQYSPAGNLKTNNHTNHHWLIVRAQLKHNGADLLPLSKS